MTQALPNLTDDTFPAFLQAHPAVLVEFYAPWDGTSQRMLPIVQQLTSTEGSRLAGALADVDNCPIEVTKFNITTIPVSMFFRDGQQVAQQVGYVPPEEFTNWINGLLS